MDKMEKLARELNAVKRQVAGMNTPQLAYSAIEDGSIKEYDKDGNLTSIIGKQVDGTHGLNVVAGPIPPAPAGAEVQGGTGVIRVKWNGVFANNNVAPLDFARVEAHISDTPNFEFDPLPNSDTRAGTIEGAGGGEVALIRTAGTYYIKLITRATTGKFSEPTAEFSVIVDPVVSQQELQGILDEVQQANADLATLQITLGEVETDLENAQAILDGVDEINGRLDNLEIDVTTLSGEVANAEAAATNAVTQAQAAASTAGAAQTAADAAATAASNAAAEAGAATQAAQNAEAEALAAANLVAEKSTVYWGLPEPAGDPNGLWIKDGKPYLWDGNEWVESENADLTQAVADAASAKADADAALSTANQAAADAADAKTAADNAAADAAGALSAADTAVSAAQSAETAANAAALSAGDALTASNAASAAAGAAQLAADAAETVATDAQAAADAAVSQANDALVVADEARTAGQNAVTTAGAAETNAANALTEAQNAASDALTAIGTANAATTAAQTAQEAADDANAEALAAAGLAGSKGEVIYQSTAPTGSRAVSQNLWIRTTDNKPHTYDGTKWVAVTDKTATDAASAAATAQGRADSAWNLANTANGTANTALATANGKNKVTYSPNAPGTAANTAGDIWFRRNASGVIIGQWEGLGGTSWVQRTIGNTVIANLDAGKITSGYIDADRINAGTITIGMIADGDVATPSDVSTAKTEAINAAAADAQSKADAAKAAAEAAAKSYADGEIDAAALAVAEAAATDAQNKADAAKTAAINAAASDATSKANAAKTAAINAAAADAQSKADAAKAAAEQAAKQYADGEISAAALATANAAAADAQDKADAAQAAAIAEAEAVEARALSRGTDLVTNGTGYLGTGYNWSSFIINPDAPAGAAIAFDTPASGSTAKGLDETIPVDPAKVYKVSYSVKQRTAGVTSRHYSAIQPIDAAGAVISPAMYMYRPGTTTALTQPVNNGDTVLHVESTANWKTGDPANHWRTIIVWNYTDSFGKTWPAHTYSRIYEYDAYDKDTGIGETTITLLRPWDNGSHPAGTLISNGGSGSSYMYPVSNQLVPEEWTNFSGTIGGGVHDPTAGIAIGGNPTSATKLFPPGTAAIKYTWLVNRDAVGGTSQQSFANASFSDTSAAKDAADAAQATADAASGTITLWKHPNATLIDGGKIYTDSITANQIASGAITADELAANSVTAAKIDAGAVTAGKIDANAVTANTIAANAVTAGKVNADAITTREIAAEAVTAEQIKAGSVVAGKIATGAVTAGTIAADAVAAGTIAADAITGREINALAINTDHLVSGAITADKLAVNSVTAEKIVGLTITGDKIAANAIGADKIVANSITGDKIAANTITAAEIKALTITSAEIATNAITADKIKAGEIGVGKLEAGTLSASNLEAGYINASIGIGVAGNITVGDLNSKFTALDNMGFGSYLVKAVGEETVAVPLAQFGVGESMVAIADQSGEYVASIDNEGHIEGSSLSTPGDAYVDGKLYLNSSPGDIDHDPIEFGPVINGQALFDEQFLEHYENHPRLGASNKWLLGIPFGTVAQAQYSLSDFDGVSMTSGYIRELAIVSFNVQPSRSYRISGNMGSVRRKTDDGSYVYASMQLRRSSGTSPVGYNQGTSIGFVETMYETSSRWVVPQFEIIMVGGTDLPVGQVNLCLYFEVHNGGLDWSASATTALTVQDIGRHATDDSLTRPNGRTGGGTTAPPPVSKKEYTKTYTSNWSSVWNPYGHDATYDTKRLIGGRSAGGNSYRAYAGFPSMISDLSGAEIIKAEMYVYKRWQDYRGSHVAVGLHDAASRSTSSEPSMSVIKSQSWDATGGKWITIPSSYYAGLKSGAYRGISIGRKSSPTSNEWWAECDRHDGSNKPKIRITYRK